MFVDQVSGLKAVLIVFAAWVLVGGLPKWRRGAAYPPWSDAGAQEVQLAH